MWVVEKSSLQAKKQNAERSKLSESCYRDQARSDGTSVCRFTTSFLCPLSYCVALSRTSEHSEPLAGSAVVCSLSLLSPWWVLTTGSSQTSSHFSPPGFFNTSLQLQEKLPTSHNLWASSSSELHTRRSLLHSLGESACLLCVIYSREAGYVSHFWIRAPSITYGPRYSMLCVCLSFHKDSHEVKSISLICLCFYQIILQHVFNKPLLPNDWERLCLPAFLLCYFLYPTVFLDQINSWLSFVDIPFLLRPHMH